MINEKSSRCVWCGSWPDKPETRPLGQKLLTPPPILFRTIGPITSATPARLPNTTLNRQFHSIYYIMLLLRPPLLRRAGLSRRLTTATATAPAAPAAVNTPPAPATHPPSPLNPRPSTRAPQPRPRRAAQPRCLVLAKHTRRGHNQRRHPGIACRTARMLHV